MSLIGKVAVGKAAADVAGHEIRKAKKKTKKAVKRTVRTVLLMLLAFCAGAAGMGYLTYTHRDDIAAAVNRKALPFGQRFLDCLKQLKKKQK